MSCSLVDRQSTRNMVEGFSGRPADVSPLVPVSLSLAVPQRETLPGADAWSSACSTPCRRLVLHQESMCAKQGFMSTCARQCTPFGAVKERSCLPRASDTNHRARSSLQRRINVLTSYQHT